MPVMRRSGTAIRGAATAASRRVSTIRASLSIEGIDGGSRAADTSCADGWVSPWSAARDASGGAATFVSWSFISNVSSREYNSGVLNGEASDAVVCPVSIDGNHYGDSGLVRRQLGCLGTANQHSGNHLAAWFARSYYCSLQEPVESGPRGPNGEYRRACRVGVLRHVDNH